MPIRAYLDGHKNFDDETIRRMGVAFETALASVGATRGYEDQIRAALARSIIALAEAGERLCADALRAVSRDRSEGGQAAET